MDNYCILACALLHMKYPANSYLQYGEEYIFSGYGSYGILNAIASFSLSINGMAMNRLISTDGLRGNGLD